MKNGGGGMENERESNTGKIVWVCDEGCSACAKSSGKEQGITFP
jgi:hypothetical protein